MLLHNHSYANGEYYHVFNRGIDRRPVFLSSVYYQRFTDCLFFYQHSNLPIKLSKYYKLSDERKYDFTVSLKQNKKLVSIICYALMPNHFHLLLRQNENNGISTFISLIENSYTRYFNIKKKRNGVLFNDKFKAVHIETDEQLIHVSRYIHLNPHTGFIVKEIKDLFSYPWTSISEYVNNETHICEKSVILSQVKNYKQFVIDQAEYQKSLKTILHLSIDNS